MKDLSKSAILTNAPVQEWLSFTETFRNNQRRMNLEKSSVVESIQSKIEKSLSGKAKYLLSSYHQVDYDPKFRSGYGPGQINRSILATVAQHFLDENPFGFDKAVFPPIIVSLWIDKRDKQVFVFGESFEIPDLGLKAIVIGIQPNQRNDDDFEIVHVAFIESHSDENQKSSRHLFIRQQAVNTLELTKGFLPEQRDKFSNEMKTMEELAGYVLELTNE